MEMITNASGIYGIIHMPSQRIYVGSAVHLRYRHHDHFGELAANKHHNPYMQRAWNKHGEQEFTWTILELVPDRTKLIEREQYWIDHYNSASRDHGFNISPTAGSNLGAKLTEEACKNIGIAIRACNRMIRKGSEHMFAKLTEAQVLTILERCAAGESHLTIAKDFNLDRKTINLIARRINWKSVQISPELEAALKIKFNKQPKGKDNINTKLTEDKVRIIKARITRGDSTPIIAKDFGVGVGTIGSIKRGKTWAYLTDIKPLPGEPIRSRAPRTPKKKAI